MPYHSTIKVFHPDDDIKEAIKSASPLDLTPPDPKKTTINPIKLKNRFDEELHVLELGGDADKVMGHNEAFSHMGFKNKYKFKPHITIDEDTFNDIKNKGHKTAHDAGISFSNAELRQGEKAVKKF